MKLSTITSALVWVAGVVSAASTFSPARPPAIPLAVKSPYLNTYLQTGSDDGDGGYLAGRWAQHWSQTTTAMAGYIRVDGKVYEFMGNPNDRTSGPGTANQTSFSYSATRSVFTQIVGPVKLTTTFLSPIYPQDQKRASIIASYVQTEATSVDGATHDVQLYMDVSGGKFKISGALPNLADNCIEWASGAEDTLIKWDYEDNSIASHTFERQTPLDFSEINDRAEWGTWYWSTTVGKRMSYQSGADTTVRTQFINNGNLTNTKDTNFRAIDNNYPVFGFSHDLGDVTTATTTRLFTIGLYQEQAIQFLGLQRDVQIVPSLWTSYFTTATDAAIFHLNDYATASSDSDSWDSKIASDSKATGGADYATITTLATRQAFGAVQIVGNSTKQYVFLKEISSDGNVNTVDVIYPAIPIFLYTNATYVKLLLDPLFEDQEGGHYPKLSSIHDIGTHYPNATGHPDGNDEPQPLEECGNMLVMTLAYAQRTNDVAYLTKHYPILDQWTQYLIEEALYPEDQITTDDFAGSLPNQTNAALKGMVGIASMAQIANLTGHTAEAKNYSDIAQSYISQWQNLSLNTAANPPHSIINYNNPDTWGTLYNLYADRLVNTKLVPQYVYDLVSNYYLTVQNKYGLPLDHRDSLAKGDWEMWIAAAGSSELRSTLITKLATWINETPTSRPFTDLYDTVSGNWPDDGNQFNARPVVGGMFSLLALES